MYGHWVTFSVLCDLLSATCCPQGRDGSFFQDRLIRASRVRQVACPAHEADPAIAQPEVVLARRFAQVVSAYIINGAEMFAALEFAVLRPTVWLSGLRRNGT